MHLRNFCLAAALCCVVHTAWAWTGAPSPQDSAHLVVARAANFRTASGEPAEVVDQAGAPARQAIPVKQPVAAKLRVLHAGQYTLWLRLNVPLAASGKLQVALAKGKTDVLAGHGSQGPGVGGGGGPARLRGLRAGGQQNGRGGTRRSKSGPGRPGLREQAGRQDRG